MSEPKRSKSPGNARRDDVARVARGGKQAGADPARGRDHDQGIARDSLGQEQPKDKSRAQQSPGEKAQRDAARDQPPSPGEPAGGE